MTQEKFKAETPGEETLLQYRMLIIAFMSCSKKDNSIAAGWELVGAGDKAAGDERA